MSDLALQRRFFAEEIEALCNLQTDALVEGLATVPREAFLPPGPWIIRSEADFGGPQRRTADGDPRHVYHNLSVAIDSARQLFNGAPGLLALCIDRLSLHLRARVLHIGCGSGYYTALMARCVGPLGRVVAIEVDEALAATARKNLAPLKWVDVRCGDGTGVAGESFDAVFVNAGVTHPQTEWLDALAPEGRLILPLTCSIGPMGPIGKGLMVKVSKTGDGFEAAMITIVSIYSALGLRDEACNARLGVALRRGPFPAFTRLRRDPHEESPSCWFHGTGWCLSS